jgi:hypothetical protein
LPIITAGFDSIRAGNFILQLYHAPRGQRRLPVVAEMCGETETTNACFPADSRRTMKARVWELADLLA